MPDLITLAEAKAHLRITADTEDVDLNEKILSATQVVIDYLTRRDATWNATMEAWTFATVPASVKAAILIQLGELYRHRGDDDIRISETPGLSATVMALLMRYRDPGVA